MATWIFVYAPLKQARPHARPTRPCTPTQVSTHALPQIVHAYTQPPCPMTPHSPLAPALSTCFPAPEYHIIYDTGASSVRATVVQFSSEGAGRWKAAGTQITVAGVGYDREIGGTEMDRRLRDILVDEFNAKHKKDIRADRRGMAKLWKEAGGRVKAVLSANTDVVATVESLAWDIDFKAKIKRAA
ncbi:hypothetical protein FIBSPDRAFT_1051705 [Athelia psychrophila]|uniref:Actin-like ATPase domain-containing protein n=1 Tax=Athelia psychrophila TaxID=1759441 RepID=A0A165YNC3_9AGAM|nr:hypothetical protein FIBSPDRAFT_1051705 [Fibularhizoctonia sp. CBS 109695]